MKRDILYLHCYGLVLIFTGSIESFSDAICTSSESERSRFGDNCQYECHCVNKSEQCDVITGNCVTGCDFAWVGVGCQFGNIAYGKSVRHNRNGKKGTARASNFANDDNLTTCSYTSKESKTTPWWNIWIWQFTKLKKLEFITTRKHLNSFSNYEVLVYNTTWTNFGQKGPLSEGLTCYKHNDGIPSDTKIQVTCDGSPFGNLIRIQLQNRSPQLVLCDVRIYQDCENGFYGNGCENCSENCKYNGHDTCNVIGGDCLDGCKPGWKGIRCGEECEAGYFGKDCKQQCNRTCTRLGRPLCNNVNGSCMNGCIDGYTGSFCEYVNTGNDSTSDNSKDDSLIIKLNIVFIIIGSVSFVIVVYATIVTVLFKRKSAKKSKVEIETASSDSKQGCTNAVFGEVSEAAIGTTNDMQHDCEYYVNLGTTDDMQHDCDYYVNLGEYSSDTSCVMLKEETNL